MKKLEAVSATIATVMISSQAIAHPGDHSGGGVFSMLTHFLTEPDHMVFVGITGFLACICYRLYSRVKASR
jgi:hydrogenase/urease accessory protein HupE